MALEARESVACLVICPPTSEEQKNYSVTQEIRRLGALFSPLAELSAEELATGCALNKKLYLTCPVTNTKVLFEDFDAVAFCPQSDNLDDELYDPLMSTPISAVNFNSDIYSFSMFCRDMSLQKFKREVFELSTQERGQLYEAVLHGWQRIAEKTIGNYIDMTNVEKCPVYLHDNNKYWFANHQDPAFAESVKELYRHDMPLIYVPKIFCEWEQYFATGRVPDFSETATPGSHSSGEHLFREQGQFEMSKDATFSGKLVFIGFGSITKATIALLAKESKINYSSIVVISPDIQQHQWFVDLGVAFIPQALTPDNLESVLGSVVKPGDFVVNLSVNVSSTDLIRFAHAHGALYLDTCIEPWEGTYDAPNLSTSQRSNYALRDQLLTLAAELGPGPTAVVAHGANPGLVSHFVKVALLKLADELHVTPPQSPEGVAWGELAMALNVKVIHIAERDTQRSEKIKADDEFVNTWSVDGFISEAGQPAELGWGSHEKTWPPFARHHQSGSNNAIYLERPGASVSVKTWTPNGGPCLGLLITHNEAISIPDYLAVRENETLLYRPTVHYAYHPCDDALLSVHEYIGRGWQPQGSKRIMSEEIAPGGVDALGVLLMGHDLNAYWYGSILSIDEARQIAPFNTATSLQVAAGVYSGIIWAIENPDRGVVEPEQMDHHRVLEIARSFLGRLEGIQTDWTPIDSTNALFHKPEGEFCPWQFEHFTAV